MYSISYRIVTKFVHHDSSTKPQLYGVRILYYGTPYRNVLCSCGKRAWHVATYCVRRYLTSENHDVTFFNVPWRSGSWITSAISMTHSSTQHGVTCTHSHCSVGELTFTRLHVYTFTVYTIQPVVNRLFNRLTTGWTTGCMYRVYKHSTGFQTGWTTGLTTGCIV